MIDNRFAFWKKGDFWKKLEMRIRYEISWDQTGLCMLKGIGGVYVRKLFEAGITTVESFIHKANKDTVQGVIGRVNYRKVFEKNNL